MRTLVKLLVAALVVHAAYRLGTAYWDHYHFQDDVQQLAPYILPHRTTLTSKARYGSRSKEDIIADIVQRIQVPV